MSDESSSFCQGITKSGEPCRAHPMPGGPCYFHAHPEQARILGQKGGRGNRYPLTEVVVPSDVTGAAMGGFLQQAMGEVLAGRMKPQVAHAIAQLVSTQCRLTQKVELEARVANLERKLAERGSAAATKEGTAVEEPAVPLWWLPPKKENKGGGNGNGSNGKA